MRIKKDDLWGIAMSAGAGVLTGMIYFLGKLVGKGEAYGECSEMLQEAITDIADESNE